MKTGYRTTLFGIILGTRNDKALAVIVIVRGLEGFCMFRNT
jgi:hypothetical protein